MLTIKRNRGAALIIALFMSALVGILLSMATLSIETQQQRGRYIKDRILAQNRVESAKSELLFFLLSTHVWIDGKVDLTTAGKFTKFNYRGVPFDVDGVSVSIEDVDGLISLYPFDSKMFESLLKSFGVSQKRCQVIVDSIEDWQDPDDFVRLFGAERGDYTNNDFPTNEPFGSRDELCHVKGMDDELCAKLMPFIVLHGSDSAVVQKSPVELIKMLYGQEYVSESLISDEDGSSVSSSLNNVASQQLESYNPFPSSKLKVKLAASVGDTVVYETFIVQRVNSTKYGYLISHEESY